MFSKLSLDLIKKISVSDRKKDGIYFTPKTIINKLLKYIDLSHVLTILEPSCGSGEFINILDNGKYNKITGIELNKVIFKKIKNQKFKNKVKIINSDFLKYNFKSSFDLIIGNPPFNVLNKNKISDEYIDFFDGRSNIFCIFILKCLKLLNKNGVLCFVLPTSFLNSAYYDKVRWFIYDNFTIKKIIDLSNFDFVETKQSTIGIIIKNVKKINDDYIVKFNDRIIFSYNVKELKELLENTTTLHKLKFKVKTGTIVWNQHKKKLTSKKKTLLLYNSDIKYNKLQLTTFRNKEKKRYINFTNYEIPPFIVVNRGNGNSKYKFNYCLITQKCLVENHLNIIYSTKHKDFDLILKSFKNKKTQKFINLFFGNNGLSKTELENYFPIYLD